jgi:hypothetical protein
MTRGIVNLGASCYCNSTVQMLYSIPEFRQSILENDSDDAVSTNLRRIFKKLEGPGTAPTDIRTEFLQLHCFNEHDRVNARNREKMGIQQDATEFLNRCIFMKLEEIGRLPAEFLMIQDSMIQCGDNVKYRPSEHMPSIIPISLHDGVNDIQNNLSRSLQEDLQLSKVCDRRPYKKSSFFSGITAKYLFLTLNRFIFTTEINKKTKERVGIRRKINTKIKINNQISIPLTYAAEIGVNYRVKGFISHLGTTPNSGHYYYSGKAEDDVWRRYNDTSITRLPYDETDVYLDVESNEESRGYIILYERGDTEEEARESAQLAAAIEEPLRAAAAAEQERIEMEEALAAASAPASMNTRTNSLPGINLKTRKISAENIFSNNNTNSNSSPSTNSNSNSNTNSSSNSSSNANSNNGSTNTFFSNNSSKGSIKFLKKPEAKEYVRKYMEKKSRKKGKTIGNFKSLFDKVINRIVYGKTKNATFTRKNIAKLVRNTRRKLAV